MPKGIRNKKPNPPAPQEAVAPTPATVAHVEPSPAILKLQEQVVDLVGQRTAGRQRLTESHSAYLAAQSAFQSAQAELQGIEQEVTYRIDLIARLENRTPMAPVLQMPSMSGVSAEPTPQQRGQYQGQQSADDMVSRAHASRDPNALTAMM